ncbi:MAG: ATP-binding cassette domain-containing protein [Desulfobacterales bacterium]|jgi:phospholipid/cholesterol/gamma-HCH transport system ATP-binding protein
MTQPLIEFRDVHKAFGSSHILRGTNLKIPKGEITTIIGKSGTGKSVFFKHVIGLLTPDSGDIICDGKPMSAMTRAELYAWRGKFSYMFQNMALFDSMTIFENVALPLEQGTNLPKEEIRKRAHERLGQLDLEGIDHKYPSELSGGMQKRVAMARALVTNPEIILFDEPTTGLDPIRKNAVHSMISEYQSKFGFTVMMISHEIPDVFLITQQLAMLDQGEIIFQGPPEDIQNVQDTMIQEFVTGLQSPQDELTGMDTVTQGKQHYNQAMEKMKEGQSAFSIVVLTLEDIEEINAELGHVQGQTILKNFSSTVKPHLREGDSCSRHGLAQLMIVLHNAGEDDTRRFCFNLAQKLKAEEILNGIGDKVDTLNVSAGFCEAPMDAAIDEVLASAKSREATFLEFTIK